MLLKQCSRSTLQQSPDIYMYMSGPSLPLESIIIYDRVFGHEYMNAHKTSKFSIMLTTHISKVLILSGLRTFLNSCFSLQRNTMIP